MSNIKVNTFYISSVSQILGRARGHPLLELVGAVGNLSQIRSPSALH